MKTLQFAGPNDNVTISDMMTIGLLHRLETLNVDQQVAFGDESLKVLGTECLNLRTLSCAACYGVSDAGILCLSSCHQLSDVTISYCHLVTDQGLFKLLHSDVKRLCMRACQGITDYGIGQIAWICLQLQELDVSGCLSVSNQSLRSLQESILYIRAPQHRNFTLLAGGSGIEDEAVLKFATATIATINLYDLSIPSLSADYDPYLFIAPLVPPEEEADEWEVAAVRVPPAPLVPPEEEADEWEVAAVRVPPAPLVPPEEEADEWEVPCGSSNYTLPTAQPDPHQNTLDLHTDDHHNDYLLERAEDYLVADEPALLSDEFSGPEEWGFG